MVSFSASDADAADARLKVFDGLGTLIGSDIGVDTFVSAAVAGIRRASARTARAGMRQTDIIESRGLTAPRPREPRRGIESGRRGSPARDVPFRSVSHSRQRRVSLSVSRGSGPNAIRAVRPDGESGLPPPSPQ
jgi:hypothetical protein